MELLEVFEVNDDLVIAVGVFERRSGEVKVEAEVVAVRAQDGFI